MRAKTSLSSLAGIRVYEQSVCDRGRLLPPLKSYRPLHGSVYLLHYFRHGSAL